MVLPKYSHSFILLPLFLLSELSQAYYTIKFGIWRYAGACSSQQFFLLVQEGFVRVCLPYEKDWGVSGVWVEERKKDLRT